jgi:lysophospholipase L1-like esterase
VQADFTVVPNKFYTAGGYPFLKLGNFLGMPCVTAFGTGNGNIADNPPISQVCGRFSFVADAVSISMALVISTPYRFLVNDQYVSLAPTTANATQPAWTLLDFTTVGGRQKRKITIETALNAVLTMGGTAGIWVGAAETISAVPNSDRVRWIAFGDSLLDGSNATVKGDTYSFVMADYLGVSDMWSSGSGGTGYLATSSGTKYNFLERMVIDGTSRSPDVISLHGGVNDIALSNIPGTVANFLACLTIIRQALPTVPIFVFGVGPANNTTGIADAITMENALFAAMNASPFAGDYNMFQIPISTAPDGAWITAGNYATYMDAGGPHPNTLGHQYWGMRAADAVLTAITNKY